MPHCLVMWCADHGLLLLMTPTRSPPPLPYTTSSFPVQLLPRPLHVLLPKFPRLKPFPSTPATADLGSSSCAAHLVRSVGLGGAECRVVFARMKIGSTKALCSKTESQSTVHTAVCLVTQDLDTDRGLDT